MPFQSDEQRKAAFANMRKGGGSSGGGGGSKSPKTPKQPKAPKQPGTPSPGIPDNNSYMPGPSPAPSDWATPNTESDYLGSYGDSNPGMGAGQGPYEQIFSLTPEQAIALYAQETSLGMGLYNLLVYGIDPMSGQAVLPYGTPGQLKDPISIDPSGPAWEYHFGASFNSDGTVDNPATYGGLAQPKGTSGINPMFLNVKPPKKKKSKKGNFFNPTGQ